MTRILNEFPANLQSQLGWKTVLHLLSVTGRHSDTYDQVVDTLITLMSDGANISRTNYAYCIDCAFGFVALRNSPVDKNTKLMDLMAESVKLLVQWFRSGYSDPGSNTSMNRSSSKDEICSKALASSNFTTNVFLKLGEALRKTRLARREAKRNHAILTLQKSFTYGEELYFTHTNCMNCFNQVIFAMVDDLHETRKCREGGEKHGGDFEAVDGVDDRGLFAVSEADIRESPAGFRTFWLGILRRDGDMYEGQNWESQSKLQQVSCQSRRR